MRPPLSRSRLVGARRRRRRRRSARRRSAAAPLPHALPCASPFASPQNGLRPGDPGKLAKDLAVKLQELQASGRRPSARAGAAPPPFAVRAARGARAPLTLSPPPPAPYRPPARPCRPQRASQQMDGIWRMQLIRETAAKRDLWKRCGAAPPRHRHRRRRRRRLRRRPPRLLSQPRGAPLNAPAPLCASSSALAVPPKPTLPPPKQTLLGSRSKVEHTAEEAESIRCTLAKYAGREQRRAAELMGREELMAAAELGRRTRTEAEETAALAGTFSRSRGVLEEMFETGTAVLSDMAGNRERLKARARAGLREGTGRFRRRAQALQLAHSAPPLPPPPPPPVPYLSARAARATARAGPHKRHRPGRVAAAHD